LDCECVVVWPWGLLQHSKGPRAAWLDWEVRSQVTKSREPPLAESLRLPDRGVRPKIWFARGNHSGGVAFGARRGADLLGAVGGLSPLVATWLVERTADQLAPAYLVMAAVAISFLSVLTFRAGCARF
jgi:hypothetical protein